MFVKKGIILISALVFSCGTMDKKSGGTSSSETITASANVDPQQMKVEGYMLGTVIYSDKEGDCPYTIQMPGDKMEFYYLDPINLDEKYKKDGIKVWIKFNGLRRMNRCDKATPAEITDIKKGG